MDRTVTKTHKPYLCSGCREVCKYGLKTSVIPYPVNEKGDEIAPTAGSLYGCNTRYWPGSKVKLAAAGL